MPSPRRSDWPVVVSVVAMFVLVPLGGYIGGYFAVSELDKSTRVGVVNGTTVIDVRPCRIFRAGWLRTLYWPVAEIESLIRGSDLHEYDVSGYEFFP